MSEIPETPTRAARALIAWFAGGLAFKCVEVFGPGSYLESLSYGVGAIIVAIVDYKLISILAKSPDFTKSLNRLARNALTWFVIGITTLLIVTFSPYVEQHRWPFERFLVTNATRELPIKVLEESNPWLAVAFKEYGQARLVGNGSNPRILEYLHSIPGTEHATDKNDWASAFAEWCLNQVGINGPKNMKAKAWITWGHEISNPRPGAIAVFNFDGTEHVGFVLIESGDDLIVLGGNQEEKVEVRRYPKSKLIDYRMPPGLK